MLDHLLYFFRMASNFDGAAVAAAIEIGLERALRSFMPPEKSAGDGWKASTVEPTRTATTSPRFIQVLG